MNLANLQGLTETDMVALRTATASYRRLGWWLLSVSFAINAGLTIFNIWVHSYWMAVFNLFCVGINAANVAILWWRK